MVGRCLRHLNLYSSLYLPLRYPGMAVLGLCILDTGRQGPFAIADAMALLQMLQRSRQQGASLYGSGRPRHVIIGQRLLSRSIVTGTLIWIVRNETKGYVTISVDLDDIATYGGRGRVDGRPAVDASVSCGALYYLEVVAVDVEWMATSVKVVDYYFDRIVIIEYLRVGGMTVDDWVGGIFPHAQGCVK